MSLFTFDHIHLLSSNPQEAADWYCEMLGGTIEKNEVIIVNIFFKFWEIIRV